MAVLVSFDRVGDWRETWVCDGLIRDRLAALHLRWGRWPLPALEMGVRGDARAPHAAQLAALNPHGPDATLERLRIRPGNARQRALKGGTLAERVTAVAQTLYFLKGAGLLYLRTPDGYLALLCEPGEWLTLSATACHWFDVGDAGQLDVVRATATPHNGAGRPSLMPRPDLPSFDGFVDQMLELTGNEVALD